jgi:phthalate 4,5-cis-dihydrodiol dehydrogenase
MPSNINPEKPLRLGVVGMGRAFTVMLPTFIKDTRIDIVAGADPRQEARSQFERDFGGAAYETCQMLLDNSDIDIVYLATPAELHVEQIKIIAAAGKHVLLEKPMALTIEDGQKINRIVKRAGIHLIVGHSHGFNQPIQQTRELIKSGEFGKLQMLTALNYTDFMYRPRRPDELITEKGGGVVFSQAAHQIDIIRILGGGCVKSIRANAGRWDATRDTEGAYNALFTFEDGVTASATYSGYAHFDSDEFMEWSGELGNQKNPDTYWQPRKKMDAQLSDMVEADLKASQNFGGKNYAPQVGHQNEPLQHQHFGTIIASCEKADIRPMPWGVVIYGDEERNHDQLSIPVVPRSEVIDEIINTVNHNTYPIHDGAWALANLEVTLAILESSRTQKEITLKYQVSSTRDANDE